ncbi:MAG: hypothetical protein VB085_12480, partial [Peptococcaceae bacterium]|nr:hypothetical protein [Peptococcaceae bacterium]
VLKKESTGGFILLSDSFFILLVFHIQVAFLKLSLLHRRIFVGGLLSMQTIAFKQIYKIVDTHAL